MILILESKIWTMEHVMEPTAPIKQNRPLDAVEWE